MLWWSHLLSVYALRNLCTLDDIPISDEVFVQIIQLSISLQILNDGHRLTSFISSDESSKSKTSELLMIRSSETDFGMTIYPFISALAYLLWGETRLTCCRPHLRKIWAWDFPWAIATFWIEGWSNLIALANGPHAWSQFPLCVSESSLTHL